MKQTTRRKLLQGIGAAGLATAIAGCSSNGGDASQTSADGGGDSDGDDADDGMDTASTDTESTSTEMDDSTTSEYGSGGDAETSSVTFDYTFSDSDDVVGSSLTGLSVDFPDGSSAVSDVSLGNVLLGGGSVARDIDDTTTSNNGTTYTIDFGGENAIEAGDELSLDLSNLNEPSGAYEATGTVNPQSGATEFTESFSG